MFSQIFLDIFEVFTCDVCVKLHVYGTSKPIARCGKRIKILEGLKLFYLSDKSNTYYWDRIFFIFQGC